MPTLIDVNRPRHPEKEGRPDTASPRKPDWIRVRAPTSLGYHQTKEIVRSLNLVTVCEEAACPNIGECWSQKHATFMILGEVCTRACSFCNVARISMVVSAPITLCERLRNSAVWRPKRPLKSLPRTSCVSPARPSA